MGSVVYVELTDSALRSLEDYLKHRAVLEKSGPGPTIQFSESGGAICLPSSGERGQVTWALPTSNSSPSQYQTSRPASQPSQATDHQHRSQAKYPSALKSNPSKPMNTEIMKKTLRERLIHLLAVRPYKKPELLLRMYKDGVKEKDKKSIGLILREVSECKNNVHELKRSMWNDIHEDWPFYTESDKVALKRNKPQNLTPPGSDTGSTSSGHSPSSTNPASPPQITNPLKRHGVYDQPVEQGPTPKKKRVSSYKRPGGPNNWDCKSPGLTDASPRLGMVAVDRHASVSPRLDLAHDSVPDDSIPDWGQFHDGEAHRSPTVRQSPEHRSGHSASSQPVLG